MTNLVGIEKELHALRADRETWERRLRLAIDQVRYERARAERAEDRIEAARAIYFDRGSPINTTCVRMVNALKEPA